MIKIGSEELNNSGSASYNGTDLNKIIYNGTVVFQKEETGLIGANISYTPRYEDGVIKIDVSDLAFATTSHEAFTVSGVFSADIEAWASVQTGPTTYITYTGRQDVSVDLGSISVPAGQTTYGVNFPTKIFSIAVESGTTTTVPNNKVEDNFEAITLTRDGFSTIVGPWHIGIGFTY